MSSKNTFLISSEQLVALYMHQMVLQAQLIDAQQKIIELQDEVAKRTPNNPADEEVFWHLASGGMFSTDAAASTDLATVQKFMDWNVKLAENHVKPYVSPKVYGEVLNQMTRGLPTHLATLKTHRDGRRTANKKTDSNERIIQLALLHEG